MAKVLATAGPPPAVSADDAAGAGSRTGDDDDADDLEEVLDDFYSDALRGRLMATKTRRSRHCRRTGWTISPWRARKVGSVSSRPRPHQPEPPDPGRSWNRWSEEAFEDYNRQRREWHANLGPIKTPQLAELRKTSTTSSTANAQDGDKAKGRAPSTPSPGLGKTTAVLDFARSITAEIKERGTITSGVTSAGRCAGGVDRQHRHGGVQPAMLAFFAHPGCPAATPPTSPTAPWTVSWLAKRGC